MTIDRLDSDFKIPYDEEALRSGDPVRMSLYLLEFAETIQLLLARITDVANFSLSLADGDAVYYALPDSDGNYPIGTWRRIQVGDNLEDQVQLILGVWTMAQTRERPM